MIFFDKLGDDNRVVVPGDYIKSVYEYINKRVKNNDYDSYVARRGHRGIDDCIRQDSQSKPAEYAAYKFLSEGYGLNITKPDLNYYYRSNKTYNPDLKAVNSSFLGKEYKIINFHCKSCDEFNVKNCKFSGRVDFETKEYSGESYLFTDKDPLFKKYTAADWIVFVFIPWFGKAPERDLEFYVRAVVPWSFIVDNDIFLNTRKNLPGKRCVYIDHLREKLN